uniref:Chaperonin containing TCP1 subunit 7 n=1 Tax=Aotus nancymaae TaxID=37293 RepID=A0A2K5CF25_AOTNA
MLNLIPTPVILLKEGTDSSQGIPQLVSNISACQVIAEAVRTTLGPRGMDKLIVDGRVSEAGETVCGGRFTPPDHHSSFPHSHPAGMAVLFPGVWRDWGTGYFRHFLMSP